MLLTLIWAIIRKKGVVAIIFEGSGCKTGGSMQFGLNEGGPNSMRELIMVLQKYIDNINAELATKDTITNINN